MDVTAELLAATVVEDLYEWDEYAAELSREYYSRLWDEEEAARTVVLTEMACLLSALCDKRRDDNADSGLDWWDQEACVRPNPWLPQPHGDIDVWFVACDPIDPYPYLQDDEASLVAEFWPFDLNVPIDRARDKANALAREVRSQQDARQGDSSWSDYAAYLRAWDEYKEIKTLYEDYDGYLSPDHDVIQRWRFSREGGE